MLGGLAQFGTSEIVEMARRLPSSTLNQPWREGLTLDLTLRSTVTVHDDDDHLRASGEPRASGGHPALLRADRPVAARGRVHRDRGADHGGAP